AGVAGGDHPCGRRDRRRARAACVSCRGCGRGPRPLMARPARALSNGEWILLLALVAEVALFAAIAQNFFTLGNLFEIVRLSVELGLLAIALTPVIVSGGIDLTV